MRPTYRSCVLAAAAQDTIPAGGPLLHVNPPVIFSVFFLPQITCPVKKAMKQPKTKKVFIIYQFCTLHFTESYITLFMMVSDKTVKEAIISVEDNKLL